MNMSLQDGLELCRSIILQIQNTSREVVVAVPYIHLAVLRQLCENSNLKIAAQNCHHENSGAYTGEISPAMLTDLGIDYVIIGHSERRAYNGETSDLLAKKVVAALAQGLKVIYCFGETLEQRKSNIHFDLVTEQITEGLFHLDVSAIENIVLAYEPVWAIGTGKTPTLNDIEEMHSHIRKIVLETNVRTNKIRILYGGSVKPNNAAEIFELANVDGALVGGASLSADDFLSIIQAGSNEK